MSERPPECCGVCPRTDTGYDCTCAGNPRCKKATKTKLGEHYMVITPALKDQEDDQ